MVNDYYIRSPQEQQKIIDLIQKRTEEMIEQARQLELPFEWEIGG